MAYTLYLSFILIRLGLGLFEYGVKKVDLFGAPFHRNCSNFPWFSSVEMDETNKNPSELHRFGFWVFNFSPAYIIFWIISTYSLLLQVLCLLSNEAFEIS